MIAGWFVEAPWIVFVAYWIFAARNTQRTEKKEPFAWRYGIMLLVVLGFVLVFYGGADIGVLGHKVFHRGYYVAVAGIGLTWAGIALAIWARAHLGQYWSGRITIKEDHKLICSGPYARLRHPIYSGLDLAVIGAAVTIDHWRCVVGVCLVIVGFAIKAKREEAMLTARFGEAFREHSRRTGFLLPKVSSQE